MLTFDVEGTPPGGLRLEHSNGGRIRLRTTDRTLMWGRVWDGFWGVTLVRSRSEASPDILPPFRAHDARRRSNVDAWLHPLAQALVESPRSPLVAGTWQLCGLVADGSRKDVFVVPGQPSTHELGYTACEVLAAAADAVVRDEVFGPHGSWLVWPLRAPSGPDAPRVKAWRRHAREGALPPIVLWSVSGLQSHLLVDGHDRLVAAALEGVTPSVLTLVRVVEPPPAPGDAARTAAVYEQWLDAIEMSPRGRVAFNERLVRAFAPLPLAAPTLARAKPGLDDEWDAEVRAVVGPGHEDLFAPEL